jgi:hypothetical protein
VDFVAQQTENSVPRDTAPVSSGRSGRGLLIRSIGWRHAYSRSKTPIIAMGLLSLLFCSCSEQPASKFRAGQVWAFKTPTNQPNAKLTVLRVAGGGREELRIGDCGLWIGSRTSRIRTLVGTLALNMPTGRRTLPQGIVDYESLAISRYRRTAVSIGEPTVA